MPTTKLWAEETAQCTPVGFRFSGLGEEEYKRRKEKLSWVRNQDNVALRAGQLEVRAAQMKHSK